ncbi:MAG: hypothetical protein ABI548_06750 [Polyangiaceae bacterium]
MSKVMFGAMNDQLSAFEAANCSACMPIVPPCAAPLPAVCTNGQCVHAASL